MPPRSKSQQAAAGRELGRRREGKAAQGKGRDRPFKNATTKQVRDFARKPKR